MNPTRRVGARFEADLLFISTVGFGVSVDWLASTRTEPSDTTATLMFVVSL